MKGKKKERKLILKEGSAIKSFKIAEWANENISDQDNDFPRSILNSHHTDTYFDDSKGTLFAEGGSLKIRDSVDMSGRKQRILVMRRKSYNTNLRKKARIEYEPLYYSNENVEEFEEVEIPTTFSGKSVVEIMKPLSSFFEFDFSTLSNNPVLICKTYRREFVLSRGNERVKMLLDNIEYMSGELTASDDIIKFKYYERSKKFADDIFETLYGEFRDFVESYYSSRYERALEKLNIELKDLYPDYED